jgi:hypothetical protein
MPQNEPGFSPCGNALERLEYGYKTALGIWRAGVVLTIPFKEIADKWLADPEVKHEYDALAPEFEAIAKSIRARIRGAKKAPNSRCVAQPDRNPPPHR